VVPVERAFDRYCRCEIVTVERLANVAIVGYEMGRSENRRLIGHADAVLLDHDVRFIERWQGSRIRCTVPS
jgi:hypothetical protein